MRGWRPGRRPTGSSSGAQQKWATPQSRSSEKGQRRSENHFRVNTNLTRPQLSPHRTPLWDRKEASRRREPCPLDTAALVATALDTRDTWNQINRVRSHRTTRSGAAGIIESTCGLGGKAQISKNQPKGWEEPDTWFTRFIEGYDGSNPAAQIECNGTETTCVLDTGAGCNLIGTDTLNELIPDYKRHMRPTKTRARDVRDKPVPLLGTIRVDLKLGGQNLIETEMEIVQDKDLLIIGNPLLYEHDLLIVAREGFGTRNAIPSTPKARNTKVFPIYAAETIPLERDDVTEVRVTTNTPKRTWSQSINRAFLVSAEEEEADWTVHPTISSLDADGTMIALIDTTRMPQDTIIEQGTRIGTASTNFGQGEHLVTAVMADLTNLEKVLRHVSADQMLEPDGTLDEKDLEIEPPGFERDGPKPGTIRGKGTKYDTERENEGGTPETATLHTRDPVEREKVRKLLQKHRNLFSKSNYDIGHFMVGGEIQKVKLTLSDTTPIVEKYRSLSPSKREAAEQILDELERARIISRKASQFASQAVWVTKAAPEMTAERARRLNIPFVPGSKDHTSPRNLRFCQGKPCSIC